MTQEAVDSLRGFDSYEIKLGDELRGERATLGKSLLDVQRELRIKAVYVDAIENCDASVFPNPGFVAGYVRSYSRYLGRDVEHTYERFCAESGFQGVNSDLGRKRTGGPDAGQPQQSAARSVSDEALRRSRFNRAAGAASGVSLAALSGLGSVAVLAALIGGLGYGGWYLLKDIQRIDFAPVAQAPSVTTEPTVTAAPSEMSLPDRPDPDARDLALRDLYAPQLEAPDIAPRDGPIAAIDPDSTGVFAPGPVRRVSTEPPLPTEVVDAVTRRVAATETTTAALGLQAVTVTVTVDTWMRVYLEDGSRIFEKIMRPGEVYPVPDDIDAPLLRSGNAGHVYLQVGAEVYGPIGEGTRVAKGIALDANTIRASWPRAELEPVQEVPTASQSAELPAQ